MKKETKERGITSKRKGEEPSLMRIRPEAREEGGREGDARGTWPKKEISNNGSQDEEVSKKEKKEQWIGAMDRSNGLEQWTGRNP